MSTVVRTAGVDGSEAGWCQQWGVWLVSTVGRLVGVD